ncbi:MAG: S49 family peptidase [Betaproteobacteria bacterium]|nr:S49 family peptidase [Betaproteobacteria bacterium]
MAESENHWEREVVQKVLLATVKEQRLARRWGIFFKSLLVIFVVFSILSASGWLSDNGLDVGGKHTALVNLKGTIASNEVNADDIIEGLTAAFHDKDTQGVILRINSPGGSPVQAGQIYDAMLRLRKQHPDIPLYVVVDDLCASGGYYVAVAADRIYVNKASLVGSIGVLMDGFGFTGTMDKLGVERRLLTAGANKGFLDPFSPVNPKQQAYAQTMLEEIHQQFIQAVRDGRGARLKETPEMFSGLVWTGATSVKLGLADGFGSVDDVARDVIHAKKLVDYTPQNGLADRLTRKIGMTLANNVNPLAWAGMSLH